MKRVIALLLVLLMVLSMAACGEETPDMATPDQITLPTTTAPGTTTFVPAIGDGVYCKTSYTTTSQTLNDNRDLVVATVGDRELTLGVLQIYYWMTVYGFLSEYGAYASYFGLDLTLPLDQQKCPESEGTWQQYFLETAVDTWHTYQCLVLQSEAENSPMDPELQKELDDLKANLEKAASDEGYSSVQQMLEQDIGPGITYDEYYTYLSVYSTGYSHYMYRSDHIEVTDAMIEEYFEKNKDYFAESEVTKESGKVVDVRHILVTPEGGTTDANGTTTYTEEEWMAAEQEAQELLDRYLNGGATEEFFAELAGLHTDDPGSKETGGLYENVRVGDMVEEFENWCFDDVRKVGDTGVVRTTYGYHVMFYSGEEAEWIYLSREGVIDEKITEFVTAAVDAYPLEANYDAMMLGHMDLAG